MKTFFAKTTFMLLFLVVFNVLFFLVVGTENPTSVWVSYGFIHFSYLTVLFLPVISSKGEASYYLSSTLYVQSIAYFLLELVVGIVFIILRLLYMVCCHTDYPMVLIRNCLFGECLG